MISVTNLETSPLKEHKEETTINNPIIRSKPPLLVGHIRKGSHLNESSHRSPLTAINTGPRTSFLENRRLLL